MRNLRLAEPRGLTDVTREIAVNLGGRVMRVRRFLPHLLARPAAAIINVSSGLAFVPLPIAPVYCATKAALHSYTPSLRAQLRGPGVTVIELAPPGTETPLFRGEFEREMSGQEAMDPNVVARRAIAGIEAGKVEKRPGVANLLRVMGRVAPDFMARQLAKMGGAGRR